MRWAPYGTKPGFVYAARAGDLIKIGYSTSPDRREAMLRYDEPAAQMLVFALGTRHDERLLHHALRNHRVRGEWFRDCERVQAVVRNIAEQMWLQCQQGAGE